MKKRHVMRTRATRKLYIGCRVIVCSVPAQLEPSCTNSGVYVVLLKQFKSDANPEQAKKFSNLVIDSLRSIQ